MDDDRSGPFVSTLELIQAKAPKAYLLENVLGSRGPRKMKVIVPTVDDTGKRTELRPVHERDSMLERYKAEAETDDLVVLKNKQPKWNDQVGAYVLNFNGRVKRASKKNFLLVGEKGNANMEEFPEDTVFLRFGKMSKTRFSLDFRYPLSPVVALGIACTTFAKKMVVT